MWILIIGLALFFGVHLVRVYAGPFRHAQVAASPGRWKGLYSLISLAGLALIVWGFARYRPDAPQIFVPPDWGRQVAMLFVLLAFIALPAAYMPAGYIRKILKHPFLAAIILWSAGHLISNGDLASLLLFGGFLVYAIVDRIAVASRPEPTPEAFTFRSDVFAITVGAVAYAVTLVWLHPVLFGVSLA